MGTPLDLTIVIPVKNEEVNLPVCLDAIGDDFARHIIVIDSGSTDNTKKIAKEYGVEVIDFEWNGKFPKKRNWVLRNYKFQTTWILFLDADEYLTKDFKAELQRKLDQNNKVGYWLNYSVFFMGKQMKGGYPLQKLALFKVGAGEYERVDEEFWSNLDMEVHEHPVLSGDVGEIRSKISHRDYRGMHHFAIKHNEYASWEASRYIKAACSEMDSSKWTFKQKVKYRLMQSIWIGPIYFICTYIIFGGYKDGAKGLIYAILKMSYFTQVYCNILEIKESQRHRSSWSVNSNVLKTIEP